jgi:hypothetical protein
MECPVYIVTPFVRCTHKNLIGIKFPANATREQKSTLLGAALLIEMSHIEQQG